MDGLFSFISHIGLESAWLPIFFALLGVPTQYVLLGTSAYKEFREVVGSVIEREGITNIGELNRLANRVASNLRVFDLDWWIVGAFGILVTTIIASGYLGDWSKAPLGSNVKNAMSLYATSVSLLIGFRLGWARLQLAKQLGSYYLSGSVQQGKDANMPPSGYSRRQADFLRDFLRSCADALVAEAREKKLSLQSALDNEVKNISNHLLNEHVSDAQKATLEMTSAFYRSVRAAAPFDEKSFLFSVNSVLNEIGNEIVGVKVAEQAGA